LTADEQLQFYRPVGCAVCNGTGFRGRIALLEFLSMSDGIARLVLGRSEAREIARLAADEGMRTIYADGLAKARAGKTTIEEVLRVTQEVQ
jgi:general secretion pathway protein E